MSRARRTILPLFIPFAGCPRRCVYCDQAGITGESGPDDVAAMGRRLEEMLEVSGGGGRHAEAAFYGGSFTALPLERQERLLSAATPLVKDGRIGGIRLSTRPDAVDREELGFLKDRGVQTIELGTPSFDDEVLLAAERGHTAEEARHAATLVREEGFDLGLQLMLGLPGDTPEKAVASARQAAALHPAFVRLYPTLVLEGTPLAGLWRSGAYRPWSLDTTIGVLAVLLSLFRDAGIAVARVGLHLDEAAQRRVLDGPWHPSLGNLARTAAAKRTAGVA